MRSASGSFGPRIAGSPLPFAPGAPRARGAVGCASEERDLSAAGAMAWPVGDMGAGAAVTAAPRFGATGVDGPATAPVAFAIKVAPAASANSVRGRAKNGFRMAPYFTSLPTYSSGQSSPSNGQYSSLSSR